MKNGMKLNVTITKTSVGDQDYIQIMSEDMVTVNVVLVADHIEVRDHRTGSDVTLDGRSVSVADRPEPKKRKR